MNAKIVSDNLMNDIFLNVKLLLDKEFKDDNLLKLYINMICQDILIQTNRTVFPEDLKYLVVNLVAEKFDTSKSDTELQVVKSLTETDKSTEFELAGIQKTKLQLIVTKQLKQNETLINRYKLLYKVGGSNE